ncbi:hypothetical protein ACNF40_03020 [Cuniculiplasma sp. SKW4]|uniref:hypothetical protein n=1 Tax=Cuniculiplasma sp. SKW4 TaxID=3400171 RepID=UPI003FD1829D
MLWGNQIFNKCVIIRVDDLFPKVIHLGDNYYGFNNIFLLMTRENGTYLIYKNVGHTMSEAEMGRFKNTLDKWNNNSVIFKDNSILQIILPDSFQVVLRKINDIVGARVTPAVLIVEGNMYIQVEFDESSNSEVSKNILNITEDLKNFKISVEYFGEQDSELNLLLNMYLEKECGQCNVEVVKTKWMITERERDEENEGLFQNFGIFIPKFFGDENILRLVFRGKESEIHGNFNYRVINKEKNLFEISVRSSFISDFYMDVIKQYYGATSLRMEVKESEVISYYLVEKNLLSNFYRGIEKHWNEAGRERHKNYLDSVYSLREIRLSNDDSP